MLASSSLTYPVGEDFFPFSNSNYGSGFAEDRYARGITSNLIAGAPSARTGLHLRYANLHRAIQLEIFERIIAQDEQLMTILRGIQALDLNDGWLVSGALYQTIWNVLTDQPQGYGIRDYDVIYFDTQDVSYEAEDRVIQECDTYFDKFACLKDCEVEVRNQARVHLWYPERFGGDYPKLENAIQSLDHYTTIAHMVGVRLNKDGHLEVAAPKGLNDIFSFVLRPNKSLDHNAPNHARKCESIINRWPEVDVINWT